MYNTDRLYCSYGELNYDVLEVMARNAVAFCEMKADGRLRSDGKQKSRKVADKRGEIVLVLLKKR